MWTAARVVHRVIHKWGPSESRHTALKADTGLVFHVSTAIHKKRRKFVDVVMHTRPQCVRGGDECGYPHELCTADGSSILVHGLSRRYPLLIHELSTILWIKGIPRIHGGGKAASPNALPGRTGAGATLLLRDRKEAVDAEAGD